MESGEWGEDSGEWRVQGVGWRVESGEWRVESRPLQTSLAVREKNGITGLSGCKIFISTDICTRTLPSGGEDVEAHLQEDGDHDQ